jgi:hypothetical protein
MLHVLCGYDYRITNDETNYHSYEGPSLNYSTRMLKENELHVVPNGLLFQNTIVLCKPTIIRGESIPLFLKGDGIREDVFDPFAATFYLVTRYEEYLPFVADRHQRFEASESVLLNKGCLNGPW